MTWLWTKRKPAGFGTNAIRRVPCVGTKGAPTFREAQQRAGKLLVVEHRRYDVLWRQFDQAGCNAQRVIHLFGGDVVGGPGDASRCADQRHQSGKLQNGAAINRQCVSLPTRSPTTIYRHLRSTGRVIPTACRNLRGPREPCSKSRTGATAAHGKSRNRGREGSAPWSRRSRPA